MLRVIVFQSLLLVCCSYAFWRGGAPERWAAAWELGADLMTGIIQWQTSAAHRFFDLATGIFVVDGIFLVSLCVIALAADRFWPIVAAGLQVADMIVHLSKAVAPEMLPYGYAWGIQFWGWPKVILFAIAVRRHRQRLARFGKDPSWSRPRHPRAALRVG